MAVQASIGLYTPWSGDITLKRLRLGAFVGLLSGLLNPKPQARTLRQ